MRLSMESVMTAGNICMIVTILVYFSCMFGGDKNPIIMIMKKKGIISTILGIMFWLGLLFAFGLMAYHSIIR